MESQRASRRLLSRTLDALDLDQLPPAPLPPPPLRLGRTKFRSGGNGARKWDDCKHQGRLACTGTAGKPLLIERDDILIYTCLNMRAILNYFSLKGPASTEGPAARV